MAKDKRSFFERLAGSRPAKEEEKETKKMTIKKDKEVEDDDMEDSEEGQLTVDVYQTPDDIIIKTMTAGVKPEDLDIAITRDVVTVRGHREGGMETSDEDYFSRELYWGSFSRTIMLPQEIDVEGAEASEKHGLLTIKLPKLDKHRETKLKVKY
jgi:HSP20 family protein